VQAQAPNPECARRYQDLFVRIPVVVLTAQDQTRANAEVKSLFGARPETCEPGGYARFLTSFSNYARDAVRQKGKSRDGMIRVSIALLEVAPFHVPAEEVRSAVSLFNQVRSDLSASIADVRATPMMEYLLKAFEASGPPTPAPGAAGPAGGAPAGEGVQSVRIPSSPMPPWVVVSLYEILEAHKQQNYPVAQGKLEVVLKWLETTP
jgi:hypothetical protein